MGQKDLEILIPRMSTGGRDKDGPTKISGPQRWVQKDEKWGKRVCFGAYRTQKAVKPRKLAFWTGKAGFSYMVL